MPALSVFILDKDAAVGAWVKNHLQQIGIEARWVPTTLDLLSESEHHSPVVCLVALRPSVSQALSLVTNFTQEPRFATTAFILMGPLQYKHAALEAGADDYLITPLDVIELRKRVRLYLDRADLQARVVAETRITQEIQTLAKPAGPRDTAETVTLLEHVAALTQERSRLEMILQHAGEAIGLVAPDGTLLYNNPAWDKMMGSHCTAQDSRIPWSPEATQPEMSQQIADVIARRVAWHGEFCYARPGESPLEVAMSITPVSDASSELVGFVVVQSDISERRALENVKSHFISDAATEMRTPVTNIKMREYLIRQAPPDQVPMHLQALERETERLSHMVEAMLELSRLDANLTPVAREPVDAARLAVEAVTRFSLAAQEHGVTLALTPPEELPALMGDTALLARVVGILIDNAIQYTPEAGHIEVRVGREMWTGGEYLTIQVQDTGIGIAPEELPFIFDRFYRGSRVRDRGTRGVGLGLSIAEAIANRHNGSIIVESQVDQGSIFTLWLPYPPPP